MGAALFSFWIATTAFGTPSAHPEDSAGRQSTELFCNYVEVFAQQLARNHIRNVPWSRLDEFEYFDEDQADFLRDVVAEIYGTPQARILDDVDEIGDQYISQCLELFSNV